MRPTIIAEKFIAGTARQRHIERREYRARKAREDQRATREYAEDHYKSYNVLL